AARALRPGATAGLPSPSAESHSKELGEQIADASAPAEDVAELLERRRVHARRAAQPRGAEAVVLGALLLVGEDAVGLGGGLELLLGVLVAGVLVRVVLEGLLAIGLLDLVRRRVPRDAENIVVVLGHGLGSAHMSRAASPARPSRPPITCGRL